MSARRGSRALAELQRDALFVSLAPVREPEFAPSAIAEALGLNDEARLDEWLRERELLLVLDNCEHLPGGAPVHRAARRRARLRVLAQAARRSTSPVSTATRSRRWCWARRSSCSFSAPPPSAWAFEDASAVKEICRRLDCLPLAIELAAARTATLSRKHCWHDSSNGCSS